MTSYHINPNTGNPGICRAINTCPFGSSSEHYPTKDLARKAYESKNLKNFPETINKSGSSTEEIGKSFVDQILLKAGYPLNVPNVNSEYKFEKYSELISSERFEFKYLGDESAVFTDKVSKKVIKIYRDDGVSNEAFLLRKFKANKLFNEKMKDRTFLINGTLYKLPRTEFVLIDGKYPVVVQEDLSELGMGYIDYAASTELNQLGFEDLRNPNTKKDYDGSILLFDCFPE